MILTLLALATFAFTAWTLYTFVTHYRQAQCLQVPILVSPVGTSNILWLLFQDILAPYITRLPFGLGSWVRYNRRAWIWQFSDRAQIHREHGPVIAHVTPAEIHVWIVDREVINEIVKGKGRGQFDKPREEIKVIDFLGEHLMTACGETWKRHRRIVATPFTQRNNRIVWNESLHQGLVLGEHWFEKSEQGVDSVWDDNETTAMNVMVTAGFGLPRESHKDLSDKRTNSFDFHSSLGFILTHFIWVILIPSTLWFPKTLPPFPKSLRDFFKSIRAFKEHLDRMVSDAKKSASQSEGRESRGLVAKSTFDNLLTALVHHSEEAKLDDQKTSPLSKNFLSDNEIYANLFGLAFAGHETTAHTLAYALFLLAAYPDVQSWVTEEIHSVIKDPSTIESLDLDETYPRLPRTRALMHETLRIFTPLPNIFKRTLSKSGATIQLRDRELHIPPRAFVLPNLYALHVWEEYWGPDALEWNPKRWVTVSSEGEEIFSQPSPPGTFLPWSDGPRACPGARFSQVEFVALCAALLRKHRITPVVFQGEDEGMARGRVKRALQDSYSVITLMVRHPEKVPLRLERVVGDGGM